MSGGSKQGSTTTTQNSAPWSGLQPFLTDLYGRAQTQSNAPFSSFPGTTVVGFSPESDAAMGYTTERAINGSPLLGAAQNENLKTLNGAYLSQGNPYLGSVSDNLWAQVRPRVDAAYANAGGFGSPGQQYAASHAFTDALAPYGFNAYESERSRMQNAMAGAPALAEADYIDPNHLLNVGQMREGLLGRQLQEQASNYYYNQGSPRDALSWYASMLQNPGGGSTTSTTTGTQPGGNTGLGILGAGLSLAGMLGTPGMFGPAALLSL